MVNFVLAIPDLCVATHTHTHTYIDLRVFAGNPAHFGPLNVGNQNKSEANEFF